jgi:RNA polymerase sigma-70 factor (ECF subfamily)
VQDVEAEFLARAQQGDDEAFAYLVEVYQRPVYNLCYRMLGNAGDAEDAAQETFIRAYKAINRYDISRKFSSWLLTIASNYCIDHHRRRKLPTFSYDSLPVPDIPDKQPGMETQIVLDERQEMVMELLEELNPKDRSAIILRYWYDYSYEEIARSLSLSVSAVKSRLHRTRRELAIEWLDMQEQSMTGERKGQYERSAA